MKLQVIATLTATLTTTIASACISLPASARAIQYMCVVRNGTPTTIARTPQGSVAVISWKSNYFGNSGFSPKQRCNLVSQRFQKHANKGTLRYITVGKMNKQNVMCVAQKQSGGCRKDGLLLTFEPTDDPATVIKELFGVSSRAGGDSVHRGEGSEPYININNVLQNAPNITPDSPEENLPVNPVQTQPQQQPTSTAPASTNQDLF